MSGHQACPCGTWGWLLCYQAICQAAQLHRETEKPLHLVSLLSLARITRTKNSCAEWQGNGGRGRTMKTNQQKLHWGSLSISTGRTPEDLYRHHIYNVHSISTLQVKNTAFWNVSAKNPSTLVAAGATLFKFQMSLNRFGMVRDSQENFSHNKQGSQWWPSFCLDPFVEFPARSCSCAVLTGLTWAAWGFTALLRVIYRHFFAHQTSMARETLIGAPIFPMLRSPIWTLGNLAKKWKGVFFFLPYLVQMYVSFVQHLDIFYSDISLGLICLEPFFLSPKAFFQLVLYPVAHVWVLFCFFRARCLQPVPDVLNYMIMVLQTAGRLVNHLARFENGHGRHWAWKPRRNHILAGHPLTQSISVQLSDRPKPTPWKNLLHDEQTDQPHVEDGTQAKKKAGPCKAMHSAGLSLSKDRESKMFMVLDLHRTRSCILHNCVLIVHEI